MISFSEGREIAYDHGCHSGAPKASPEPITADGVKSSTTYGYGSRAPLRGPGMTGV
jgi:hypothetical protein